MLNNCYEEFFLVSSELMLLLDTSGHVVRANQSFLEFLGHSTQEVAGLSFSGFVVDEDRPRLDAALERVVYNSEPERIDLRCMVREKGVHCGYTLRPSREHNHVLVTGRNYNAWYQECNTICRDYQALEGFIDERTSELKRANAELESFNFSISHDLRAPLRAIRGFSMAIAEDYHEVLGTTGNDYLRRILANCERMTTLTDYLLELSRLTRQELRNTRVDLGLMADTIMSDFLAAEPRRDVIFQRDDGMVVDGDRDLLFLLMQNLLDNAWKYSAGRDKSTIQFTTTEVDGERIFSVVDNGVGFSPSQRDKLFMLFQRLHNPEEFEGLGIGLATSQRIIKRHGGRIWAESIQGQRTVFHFTLRG